jgi:hypothetical protein
MATSRGVTFGLTVGLVVATAVGCSSGEDPTETTNADTTATTAPRPTTAAPAPPSSTSPVATTTTSSRPTTSPPTSVESGDTGPGDLGQADIDAITSVFTVFFGGIVSALDDKVAVLENGELYRDMLVAAGENEQFQQMSTDIRDVRAGSDAECEALGAGPGCAIVSHDVLVAGFPMAAGIESPAVRSGGSWLVGSRAWCNLVEIGGAVCPEEPEP